MKVALVYDRVNKIGGAERILVALHKIFPNAPLFTSVYDKKGAQWAQEFSVKTSFLQYIPFTKTHHEFLAPLMPLAFESFSFDSYNLVISVSSEAAKGVVTNSTTKHVSYLLTPTRYLWSGYKEYFNSKVFKILSYPIVWYLRLWDLSAAQRADVVIGISREVKKRIKKYYDRESYVVYPPLILEHSKSEVETQKLLKKGFFLIVSRLVPYKKIDIAIKACNELRVPLVIVGSGSEKERLKELAGPTVEFAGSLTDGELRWYYKNCKALLFPGFEDFGLTIVEAQFFGKPVIAFKGGGALETILEGKTGEFFYPQTPRALVKVLKSFKEKKYKSRDCITQAEKFSFKEFKKNFIKVLKKEYPDLII